MDIISIIRDAAESGADSLDLSNREILELPREIVLFTGGSLDLSGNSMKRLPPEVTSLSTLSGLYLRGNHGIRLPVETKNLRGLRFLDLANTGLTELPPELFDLTSLEDLDLAGNRLTGLLPAIGRLRNLDRLNLTGNQLTSVPSEIGELSKLAVLDLSDNQLATLPPEIGGLPETARINLTGNPFTGMAADLVAQGSEAILTTLRANYQGSEPHWVSKILVVGQGGVGKTCLLQRLRGEAHAESDTTYGIEVGELPLPRPGAPDVTMRLSTWDFGGQEIYHATHQFYLSDRSLYLVVWNARQEWEQGKLFYWLDTIKALAPDSPILLVATWTDERDARLPLSEIRQKYPKVVGNWSVSNTVGTGIDLLRDAIAENASRLPLMGEIWSRTWLAAKEDVCARPAGHMRPEELWQIMRNHGVEERACGVLARRMHDLGNILHFDDNPDLADIIIIRPQWVTHEISKVLVSNEVADRKGLLSNKHAHELWSDLNEEMCVHLLNLMERFDLSYRTLENTDVSLVVERLPLDPPDYGELWNAPHRDPHFTELAIRYELNTIPAGIPTWFVAREHQWTTFTHWRAGAVFAYELEEDVRKHLESSPDSALYGFAFAEAQRSHLALIQADAQKMWVKLTARGSAPANFFLLLRHGMEHILKRFPGIEVTRIVPCPGHDGIKCGGEWSLKNLEDALRRNIPEVQCPVTFRMMRVSELLNGVDGQATIDALLSRSPAAERESDVILVQREFTGLSQGIQEQVDYRCPNVFVVYESDRRGEIGRVPESHGSATGQEYVLHLCCQQPGAWHTVMAGGRYSLHDPANWFKTMGTYVRALARVMQFAAPLAEPISGIMDEAAVALFREQIARMEELVKRLLDSQEDPDDGRADDPLQIRNSLRARDEQLRFLRRMLDSMDSQKDWGGLTRVVTKEGHNLWLCEHHRAAYPAN